MKQFLLYVLAVLIAPATSFADELKFSEKKRESDTACFSPSQDPFLTTHLTAKALGESQETIDAINKIIWSRRDQIDPRLIYYRFFGESGGNPEATNPTSGAYGIFQFLGKPYGSDRTHKQILKSLYKAQPNKSRRLIQVEYYMNDYLQKFIAAADGGYGCVEDKKFATYTNIEKVCYLGWGACDKQAQAKEKLLCEEVHSYRNGPCQFAKSVIAGTNNLPVCGNP